MRGRLGLGVVLAAIASGCGAGEERAPSACLGGPAAYLEALQAAPEPVRLAPGAAISSCLVEDQRAGELARVGIAVVRAATELNERARGAPEGAAPVQLGYLVGALRSGAEDTAGIHADLLRRIEAAAELTPRGGSLPRPLATRYASGIEAGRRGG